VRCADHSAPHCIVFPLPLYLVPLGPNNLLNTLFSNTLSLRSSLKISDQVSHSYKTTGKMYQLHYPPKSWFPFLALNLTTVYQVKR
jgi:hypothetical protein